MYYNIQRAALLSKSKCCGSEPCVCDLQIAVLVTGVLYDHFVHVCKVPSDTVYISSVGFFLKEVTCVEIGF